MNYIKPFYRFLEREDLLDIFKESYYESQQHGWNIGLSIDDYLSKYALSGHFFGIAFSWTNNGGADFWRNVIAKWYAYRDNFKIVTPTNIKLL